MTDLSSDPPQPTSRRGRRGCLITFLLLLLPFLVLASLYARSTIASTRELHEAIAETDQLDPRWRLTEVEADRAVVPDAKNSALVVLASKPLLPAKWPFWYHPLPAGDPDEAKRAALERSFTSLEDQRQLNAEQIEALHTELKRAAPALVEARRLTDMPEGRYPITYKADFISSLLPHVDQGQQIANLLVHDAMLRTQEGDAEGALASCRAVLNTSRSFGDEPLAITVLTRIRWRRMAMSQARRALAQGQPSEADLKQFQQLLEKEEREPLLLLALRGARAGFDQFLEALQTGRIRLSWDEFARLRGIGSDRQPSKREWSVLRSANSLKKQRAAMLRFMTQAIEIAKLPPGEERQHKLEQLQATAEDQPLLVWALLPLMEKTLATCQAGRMEVRCTIAAVAAERYRREKQHWPDMLETLHESGYLKQVPIDLYDGQPLRMRRLEDGLMIYSIGPDGVDNGGQVDPTHRFGEGTDVVFRLWDAAKRRQPATLPGAADK